MYRRTTFTRARKTLLMAAGLLVCLPVVAQSDWKATVLVQQGSVSFEKDASRAQTALFQGSMVSPGQVIVTGHDGYAKLQVHDGSTFEVFPDSQVVFRNAMSISDLLNVLIGKIKVKIQHAPGIPNPNNVTTPTALISVRGTEFFVEVQDDGTTVVSCDEGSVGVRNLRAGGQMVILNPGGAVTVDPRVPLIGLGGQRGNILYRVAKASEDAMRQIYLGRGPQPGAGSVPTAGGGAQGDKGKPGTTGTGTGSPTGGSGTGSPTGGTGAPPPPPPGGGGGG